MLQPHLARSSVFSMMLYADAVRGANRAQRLRWMVSPFTAPARWPKLAVTRAGGGGDGAITNIRMGGFSRYDVRPHARPRGSEGSSTIWRSVEISAVCGTLANRVNFRTQPPALAWRADAHPRRRSAGWSARNFRQSACAGGSYAVMLGAI